eukprot:scaffold237_cov421-Prasinococcus_capsulatus_cf.AAC.1
MNESSSLITRIRCRQAPAALAALARATLARAWAAVQRAPLAAGARGTSEGCRRGPAAGLTTLQGADALGAASPKAGVLVAGVIARLVPAWASSPLFFFLPSQMRTRGQGANGQAAAPNVEPPQTARPSQALSSIASENRSLWLWTLAAAGVGALVAFGAAIKEPATRSPVFISSVTGLVAFYGVDALIPTFASNGRSCPLGDVARLDLWVVHSADGVQGIAGKDLNKKGTEHGEVPVPESAGVAVGLVFLVCLAFQQILHTPSSEWLINYNAGLACICFSLFLGFVDDVLDIPWRYGRRTGTRVPVHQLAGS